MAEHSFPKTARLLNADDFQAVFNQSRFKVSCKQFLLLAIPNSGTCSRLGLVVAKKNVARAVQRNRIKRIVRQWFRYTSFTENIDLVVLVRKDTDKLGNHQLAQKLDSLAADMDLKFRAHRGRHRTSE